MPLSLVDKFCFAFFLLEIQCGSDFINLISRAVQTFFFFSSVDKCDVGSKAVVTEPRRGQCSRL